MGRPSACGGGGRNRWARDAFDGFAFGVSPISELPAQINTGRGYPLPPASANRRLTPARGRINWASILRAVAPVPSSVLFQSCLSSLGPRSATDQRPGADFKSPPSAAFPPSL